MEMRQLQIFCAIADEGSFTGAARKVHTVQSNVTMRVKELEEELGQLLFTRQKNGVALTSAGETFLGYARRILQLTDESRQALRDDAAPAGPLRLGAMETTAAIRLPGILSRYRKLHPEVQLSLATGTTAELIKAVESRRIDAAFVGGRQQNPALSQQEVFREELVLVSSSEQASLDELTRQMPQQTLLVFRAGCFYRSTLEHWFHEVGLIPHQTLELGTLDGILSCVSAGMGLTLLPRAVVERSAVAETLRCHALPPEHGRVTTMLITRRDALPTPALRALLRLALPTDAAREKTAAAAVVAA